MGYVRVTRSVDVGFQTRLVFFIRSLMESCEDLIDTRVEELWPTTVIISGWRPMNDDELRASKARAEMGRAAAAARKEKYAARKHKQLEKLANELGVQLWYPNTGPPDG
jgi:hypothetical protein